MNSLDAACRRLLRRIFVQGVSVESIRKEEELASVQAVYYRRDVCLQRAQKKLKLHLAGALKTMSALARMKPDRHKDEPMMNNDYDPTIDECVDPDLGDEMWRADDPSTDPVLRDRLDAILPSVRLPPARRPQAGRRRRPSFRHVVC